MKRRAYSNLSQYFEKTGETQQAFADRLGVAQPHISRIVNGASAASLELAVRIANEANIPIESLLPDTNSESRHSGGERG